MPNIYFEKINPAICDVAKPPSPAIVARPDWWRHMDKYSSDVEKIFPEGMSHAYYSTARNCPALNDAYNFGYTIYLPYDIYFDATDNETITMVPPQVDISTLGEENFQVVMINEPYQMKGHQVPEGYHHISLKMATLWGVRTEEGYSTWFTQPIGHNDLPYLMFDAVVDTDKWPQRFPYSFWIKKGFKGTIPAGTPMLHVIPFKRDDWQSHIVDVDPSSVRQLQQVMKTRFTNAYKRLWWTRKKFK